MFPTIRPVTWENMNYAPVVAVAIAAFAFGWWFVGAKDVYKGPRTKEVLVGADGEDEALVGGRDDGGSGSVRQ